MPATPSNARDRLARHRAELRRAGLRPVQLWVPDTRSPAFAQACRRQSEALLGDPLEAGTMAWLDAVADDSGWDA